MDFRPCRYLRGHPLNSQAAGPCRSYGVALSCPVLDGRHLGGSLRTHPITRKLIIPISRHGQPYLGLLLYIVASIALAWVADKLIKRIPLPKR